MDSMVSMAKMVIWLFLPFRDKMIFDCIILAQAHPVETGKTVFLARTVLMVSSLATLSINKGQSALRTLTKISVRQRCQYHLL